LKAIMLDEGGLDRVKNFTSRQALNRSNPFTLLSDRESEAGVDANAIHQDGAGAALTVIAAFLCTGEVQAFTQQIEQRNSRLQVKIVGPSVDLEGVMDGGRETRGRRLGETASEGRRRHSYFDESAPGNFVISGVMAGWP
jgi:hypothetical protein